MKLLLAHGAIRNLHDKAWHTPLHVAAANGSLECVRLLTNVYVNVSDRMGHTPLHHAVLGGHTEVVRFLLESGASVNAFDKYDRRAMHWAAVCGQVEIVELLHLFGAEVNSRDKDQYTALHVAAAVGNLVIVKCLIDLGAELEPITSRGNTPLHLACLNGHDDVVETLLDAIAVAAVRATDTNSPSSSLSSNLSTESHEELRANRQDAGFSAIVAAVNRSSDLDHMTPVHLAACSTNGAYCLRTLLVATTPRRGLASAMSSNSLTSLGQSKARFHSLAVLDSPGGEDGCQPLHMAALHGRYDRVELLLDYGATIDARDRLGNTALHIAADRGHELFIVSLLRAGCPWDLRGQQGATALHRSALSGFHDCLFRLIAAAVKNVVDEQLVNKLSDDGTDIPCSHDHLDLVDFSSFGQSEAVHMRLREIMQLRDHQGRTVVHAAALGANLDCLKLVLMAGGDPFAKDLLGRTPLHYAVASCAFAARDNSSPSKDANLMPQNVFYIPPGHDRDECIYRTNAIGEAISASSVFLKLGADVNVSDKFGCTALHLACAFDTSGVLVQHLIDGAADLFVMSTWPPTQTDNEVDRRTFSRMYSPLHVAVSYGNSAAVKAILSACPTAYTADPRGLKFDQPKNEINRHLQAPSPFLYAAWRGNDKIMELLLDAWEKSTGLFDQEHHTDRRWVADKDKSIREHLGDMSPGRVTDAVGHTPLHFAAHFGHTSICQLLLDSKYRTGVSIGAKDCVYRGHALHHAAAQGHSSVVALLLKHADAQSQLSNTTKCNSRFTTTDFCYEVDEHGRTALMLAAQNNHPVILHLILSVTADVASRTASPNEKPASLGVNLTDVFGRTALHRAAANGHVECVKLLLSRGADITIRDFRQRHALHMAAAGGKLKTVRYLLRYLTKLRIKYGYASDSVDARNILCPLDQYGFSPLHFAAYRGHVDCIQILLIHTPSERLRGNIYTPLHCAAQNGHQQCLKLLLDKFGESHICTKDAHGRTALHIAALSNQVICLEEVIRQAELHLNSSGSAKQVAHSSPTDRTRFASFIAQPDSEGCTALMLSAKFGSSACVERLLAVHNQLRAQLNTSLSGDILFDSLSFNVHDVNGRTVLHHACTAPTDTAGLIILDHISDIGLIMQPDRLHRTALHLAIASGLAALTEALIQRGADLYAVDTEGRIPVLSAAPSIPVAACLSLSLAAMFPPIDGQTTENLCTHNRLSHRSCQSDEQLTLITHDSPTPSPKTLMSTSTTEDVTLRRNPNESDAIVSDLTPLSLPGSESDFF
ncbi:hypothetical protein EG68_05665 [Paragonimus skrjabini miyazakii]|uniref:Serine/threonine-protein phosphatase 6 regulatory ankyrin repeat subunit A n=1 Tax=Paragonimus skrjabini miyazakii TaxID=59628 RepID=A0A8S9YS00_9TREM|nr:hypothetical protein EG68_05665 [Paragonimus skrjabini miyazakii]